MTSSVWFLQTFAVKMTAWYPLATTPRLVEPLPTAGRPGDLLIPLTALLL